MEIVFLMLTASFFVVLAGLWFARRPIGPRSVTRSFLAVYPLAVFGLTIWYVFWDNKTNHSGMDFMLFAVPLVVLVPLAVLLRKQGGIYKAAAFFGVVTLFTLFYLDQNNFMVEHGRWCKRGMPEKGEAAKHAFQWFKETKKRL